MHFHRVRKYLLPFIPVVFILILWEFLSQGEMIDPTLFPPPTQIWEALVRSIRGGDGTAYILWPNVKHTLIRLFWGFLWGGLSGIVIGLILGNIRILSRLFEPLIAFIMPIPGIAMAPIFMVIMGFGDRTIITVGAVAMFFPVVLNVISGVRSVDLNLENAASIMGTSRIGMYIKVHLPWTMIYLFTGLKLGLARCWRTIIAVELIATATFGLGFMISEASANFQTDVFFAGIFVMASIFLIFEKLIFGSLERLTVRKWGMVRE